MDIDQLQANRAALRDEWMKHVAAAKEFGLTPDDFSAVGPILSRDNSLTLFFVSFRGQREFDLTILPTGSIFKTLRA